MSVYFERTEIRTGQEASGNVATYGAVYIGTAHIDRIIVVAVGTELSSCTINSCTIDYGDGAISMTAGSQGNQGNVYARLFYLKVPTSENADVAVTFGANPSGSQNAIVVYAVSDAAYSSGGVLVIDPVTGDGYTDSITLPAGSAIFSNIPDVESYLNFGTNSRIYPIGLK